MIIAPIIIVILIIILAIMVMISLLYSAIRYVPFVPTENSVLEKMIGAADLKDGQQVVDLGCGDGRLLIAAAREKNIQAIGIEVNPLICLLAKLRFRINKLSGKIIHANFFKVSLRQSDVVFCYLFPKVMSQLEKKFARELKKGAKIISYCFPIKSWKPVRVISTRSDKPKNFLIYVYRMPCLKK